MKKYMIKMAALLLFTSVAISSCSLEYRERRNHRNDPNWHDPHGHDHDDHHYDNNHHY
jgi:ABC-type nickel/cobalt efflux system permease component RcnA